MNNNREKNVMNLSHSSQPPVQMHNFMPMPSSSVRVDHDQLNLQSEGERHASFLKQNMQSFWRERLSEICDAPTDVRSPHSLPLARIKKVMKSDEKVKMISGDTPVLFGKACEIFVMELTLRAWMHTQLNKRKTLQRNDIAYAIRDDTTLLAFLNDIVPLQSYHHDDDNNHVPHPLLPPNYFTNQSGYMGRSGGMQQNPNFPPPDDGTNPYLTFKEFFQ